VSFQAEQKLVRLRPRASRLLLPTLVLGLVAGALAFFENRTLESWQSIAINVVAAATVVFAYLVPLVRQLVAWVEVSTTRLVWRDGLFGQRRREVSWHEVSAVEFLRGRITVFIHGQEPLVLVGLPKAKQLAREMQNLVRG
jgi:membrane protein YdbS with pleckstrin-like domain